MSVAKLDGGTSSGCFVGGPGTEALVATGGGAGCPCQDGQCSVKFGGGHIADALDLASATVEYVLDAGVLSTCGAQQTSACAWAGSCTGGIDSPAVLSTSFSYALADGGASGTQTVVFAAPDGGAGASCTWQLTFAPL